MKTKPLLLGAFFLFFLVSLMPGRLSASEKNTNTEQFKGGCAAFQASHWNLTIDSCTGKMCVTVQMQAVGMHGYGTWHVDYGDGAFIDSSYVAGPFGSGAIDSITLTVCHTYSVAGVYTITLSVSPNDFPCISQFTITIPPLSAVAVNSTTICIGSSTTLTASGGSNYSWSTGATTPSIVVSPSVTTTYTVGSGGCSSPAAAVVTVVPVSPLSVNPAGICIGSSATLTATGGSNYSWSTGATTPSIIVSPSVTTTYTVSSSGACGSSDTSVVTVSSPPVASATSVTICAGQSVSLSAGGGGNYLWSNGNTNSSISVSPTASSVYSVIVSIGSCPDTAYSSVLVNPSPYVSIADQTICSGQSIILDAGNPGAGYVWSSGSTAQSIIVSSPGSYWVIVALSNCIAMDTVSLFAAPEIDLPDSSLCTNSPIILSAGGGATSYYWSTGSTDQTISVDTAGVYWVTVMFGNCAVTAISIIDGQPGGASSLYVPNTFTPNNDDLNEMFLAKGEGIVSFNMSVFDRWGNLIFVSDDVNKGWDARVQGGHYILKKDGTETAQEDVYVWIINYTTQCFPKSPKRIMGRVSIVK